MATLDGQDHLPAIPQPGEDDEHGGLVLLQAGLDIDPVRPHVHGLEVVQPSALPRLVLRLPARLQPRDRRRRQRRRFAQQPAQGQVEVALGQPMQVQLGQEPADFLGAPLEQRQQPTLESRLDSADAGPAHRDRARHRAQPARLAEPVPISPCGVHAVSACVAGAPQGLLDLLLQQLLQQPLHPLAGERLQALPHGP